MRARRVKVAHLETTDVLWRQAVFLQQVVDSSEADGIYAAQNERVAAGSTARTNVLAIGDESQSLLAQPQSVFARRDLVMEL